MYKSVIKYKKWVSAVLAAVILVTLLVPYGMNGKAYAAPQVVAGWKFAAVGSTFPATSGSADNLANAKFFISGSRTLSFTGSNSTLWTGGWDIPLGYWQAEIKTTGFTNLTLTSKHYGTGTGPRDYKVQYSLDGQNFADVPDGAFAQSTSIATAVNGLPLTDEVDNQEHVFIRWLNYTGTSINGSTTQAGGNSRIADIVVQGEPIGGGTPDPNPGPVKTDRPVSSAIAFNDDYTTVIGGNGAVSVNATVYAYYMDGSAAGTTTANASGAFGLVIGNPGRATSVQISAKEDSKEESDKVTVSIPKSSKPVANLISFTNYTQITGLAGATPANSNISAYYSDGSLAGSVSAGADGSFALTVTNPSQSPQIQIADKEAGKLESDKTSVSMADGTVYQPGDVIFSQIYVNGTASAIYKQKFFELYNTTDQDINFGGNWSLSYSSATATAFATSTTPLTGVIKAHGYYLISGSVASAATAPNAIDLPIAVDQAASAIGPSATAGGHLVLAHKTTAITSDLDPDLIDITVFGNGTATFKLDTSHWGTPFFTSLIASGSMLRKTEIGSDPRGALGLNDTYFVKDNSKNFVMNIPGNPRDPKEMVIRNSKYMAQPDSSKMTFANASGTATATGLKGAVPSSATVNAYFVDEGALTLASSTTATADGSFTMSFADSGNHPFAYLTHTGTYGESAYARVDTAPNAGVVTPINELRINDQNGLPVHIGYNTTIEGVATSDNHALGNENTNFYLQDATGAIQVIGALTANVQKGGKYKVSGRMAFTAGVLQFIPASITDEGVETTPEALPITLDQLSNYTSAEALEGNLVTFKAEVTNIPVNVSDYNVTVTNGANSAVVSILAITGIDVAGGAVNLGETYTFTGIVGQSKASSPYQSGYLVMPRNAADIRGELQFVHEPLDKAYVGTDVTFKATVQYADSVTLYYRSQSDNTYKAVPMFSGDGRNYNGVILKADVPADKFYYYMEAVALGDVKTQGTAADPIEVPIVEDTDGPVMYNLVPDLNEEVETQHPAISLNWEDPNAIDKTASTGYSVRIDGTDFTSKATATDSALNLALTAADDLSFGEHTVTVKVKDLLGNESTLSWIFKIAERFVGGNHYYGTTHNHTNISHDAAGTPVQAVQAALAHDYDFFAFSDHSHDIDSDLRGTDTVDHKGMPERSGGADWQETKDVAKAYTEDGSFVVFPAFEMTSTTWGHSNIFGTDNFIDRVQDSGKYQDLQSYYAWVMTYDDIVAQFNHPDAPSTSFNGFLPYDKGADELFTMLEVGNGSGNYSYANSENKFFSALDKGWHLAPTYGEDNHDGTWGLTKQRTVIVSKDLTEASLLDSMRKMRVYLTEDPNAKLDVLASGWYMGSTVDTKTLSFDVTGSDSVWEEKTDPKYSYMKTTTNDNIAKVELITNGGTIIDTYVPASNSTSFHWTPNLNVVGGQQWFVVRVTQADGDRMYSAPIWSPEEPVSVKVSNLTVAEGAIVGSTPATLNAGLSNRGSVDVTNVKAAFYYDDLTNLIGEVTLGGIASGQNATASIVWPSPVTGNHSLIVVLTADQDLGENKYVQAFSIKAPLGKTIMIDASKRNENTTLDAGSYKDNLKLFTSQIRQQGYTVVENPSDLTDTILSNVSVLYISHPASAYSSAELAAIKKFTDNGGALWLAEKSNFGGTNQNANSILQAIGSTILVNNDGIADETPDGNFWATPLTSNYAVRLHPKPLSNTMNDFVPTIEYYSGASLAKNDGSGNKVPLTESGSVKILVNGNESTFQIAGSQVQSDTYKYLVVNSPAPSNLTGGSAIPAIASESLSNGGRIIVSGMNIFNDKQMDETYDPKGNNEFALNAMNWLSHLEPKLVSIGDARQAPEDTPVVVQGQVSTAAGVFFDAAYIQDDTGGIMAYNEIPEGSLALGDIVRIYGHKKVFENNTELEFNGFANSVVKVGKGTPVEPKLVTTKDSVSDTTQGQLVKVSGEVKSIPDNSSIIVDDGSGPVLVFVDGYIVNQSGPIPDMKVGDTLETIALSGKYVGGERLRVRNTKEMKVYEASFTAAEIAAGLTSIAAPDKDATTLSLPSVPAGFTVAIKSSSDPSIVATDGKISHPLTETTVSLVLTVTRTSDDSSADTIAISVAIPAITIIVPITAAEIAAGLTNIAAPAKDATALTLPSVPFGFTVAIKNSSDTSVIRTDGTITPPMTETTVNLVLRVTRDFDGTTADTVAIPVTVPTKTTAPVQTAAEVAAGITSIAAPAEDATMLTLPSVPNDFILMITNTSNPDVIGLEGTITPPATETIVDLVLIVIKKSTGEKAFTAVIPVRVPGSTVPNPTTAAEIAARLTSIFFPSRDATVLTLPRVPSGFTVEIKSSSNTEVIGTDGTITPPATETTVNLVLTVTRTFDGSKADTVAIPVEVPGTIVIPIPVPSPTAAEIAAGLTEIPAPAKDATTLTLPNVPADFTVAINNSSNTGVIRTDGTIIPPATETTVNLVLTVTRTSDGTSADTISIPVKVPAKTSSNPNPPSSNPPAANPQPTDGNETKTVTGEDLKNSGTVTIPTTVTDIKLPANSAEVLGDKPLVVKSDNVSLSIPSAVLKQLEGKLSASELVGGTIHLKLSPLGKDEESAILNQSGKLNNSVIKLSGKIFDLQLYMTTIAGNRIELSQFDKPVTMHLNIDASSNLKSAGIFGISESGELEFVGGKYSDGEYIADINGFSKFAILQINKSFVDLPTTNWAYDVVEELVARQIIDGTSEGTFEPNRVVTRAEFTAMLAKALKLTAATDVTFADIASNAWYADFVGMAYKAGIVSGKSATAFDPNGSISREEMVVMLMKAYEYMNGSMADSDMKAEFNDYGKVSSWAKDYVAKAASLNLIKGRSKGVFAPKGVSTRSEAVQVIYNLLKE
ncbi:S-layer homology domain-containing protein [Cohnella lupini]|uniref:CARDB protein n=1 Tax=Cohnella lupini TaxID=1294267 RepID=A0A3D9IVM2_9BACL|nr:S-layer homology domain-containing protein [Cohnella lupini]RED65657.1 CARDB protein [Cohnella lupini]